MVEVRIKNMGAEMSDKLHYQVVLELLEKTFSKYMFDDQNKSITQVISCKDTSLVGCEIGIMNGLMEQTLLKHFKNLKMYAIDNNECSFSAVESDLMARITFIHKKSDEAYKDITEKLDFVYIDGDHTYEGCKQDIINYFPLVKKGGIIAGHDYHPHHGVIKAVKDTLGDVNLGDNLVWWKQKCLWFCNV